MKDTVVVPALEFGAAIALAARGRRLITSPPAARLRRRATGVMMVGTAAAVAVR